MPWSLWLRPVLFFLAGASTVGVFCLLEDGHPIPIPAVSPWCGVGKPTTIFIQRMKSCRRCYGTRTLFSNRGREFPKRRSECAHGYGMPEGKAQSTVGSRAIFAVDVAAALRIFVVFRQNMIISAWITEQRLRLRDSRSLRHEVCAAAAVFRSTCWTSHLSSPQRDGSAPAREPKSDECPHFRCSVRFVAPFLLVVPPSDSAIIVRSVGKSHWVISVGDEHDETISQSGHLHRRSSQRWGEAASSATRVLL